MRRKLVPSRAAAQRAIDAGLVRVGGIAVPKASTLVAPADGVSLAAPPDRFVGRGGWKLDAALDRFDITVAGRRAVDVGASTGGFTDCLLQRGATSVLALDVGYGQIHWRLREDNRVTVVERTNVRYADATDLGAPFDVIVADLSFISLHLIAPQLAGLGGRLSDWVLLVKPQFEVGKEHVGRGGIVREPSLHRKAIDRAIEGLETSGVGAVDLTVSPITGAAGNTEFLLWARRGQVGINQERIEAVVEGRS